MSATLAAMAAMDLAISGLGLVGGGALGAALGGGAAMAMQMAGGRQAAVLCCAAVLGAVGGLFLVGGASLPALGLPGFGIGGGGVGRVRAVLQRYYPNEYADVGRELATGGSQSDQLDRVHRVGMVLMQRQFPLASPRNAVALAQLTRDEQRILAQKDPQLCWRILMNPRAATVAELQAAEPADIRARELDIAADILEQTATQPYPSRPSPDIDRKLRVWAMDSVGGLSGEDKAALRGGMPSNPTDDQARAVCHVGANLLNMIAMASPEDAAAVMKKVGEQGFSRLR